MEKKQGFLGISRRGWIILFLIIGIAIWANYAFLTPREEVQKIEASDFYTQLNEGQIAEVTIEGEAVVAGKYQSGEKFETYCPLDLYPEASKFLREKEIKITAKPLPGPSWWQNALSGFLPMLLLIGLFWLLLRGAAQRENRALGFGRSRAKLWTVKKRVTVTFNDVAGVDEARGELQEIVGFLRNPEEYQGMGARIPRGILLVGPVGTGKTLVARAVAGEANVPFFFLSGSEFVEMFVGVGASRVRDLFDQAKRNAPCIVFIDEIDAVGRHRGAGLGGGHDEREQTLNQILVEMDGFEPRTNVIVLAATNRPDILDPALLRPGRFDRQVILDRPDIKGRRDILKIHARGKPLAEPQDTNLDTLAKQTPGFTGADLENVLNEAAILAVRRRKKEIGMEELDEAVDRVMAGPERKSRAKLISQEEREIFAAHEAGHALVAHFTPGAEKVYKISCIPRGEMGGYTKLLPEKDRFILTKQQLEAELAVVLAGRLAEELKFGKASITTGAENDLERATNLARKMITQYGMSERLGPRTFGKKEGLRFLGKEIAEERNYSEKIAEVIDEEVKNFIDQACQKAKEVLEDKKEKLEEIIQHLLKYETLEGELLQKLLSN